jgi:hypothetical protein
MRTSQPPAANNSAGVTGLGRPGLGSPGGQRLPVPPRERKPALALLAVLLILSGALASAYLVMQSGERVAAIAINQQVAAGQQVPASALTEVQIGDTGINYIRWSERAKVTRAYAAVPLVKGALLTNEMLRAAGDPSAGRAVVGLSLKAGQVPASGLQTGQHVALYAVATTSGQGNQNNGLGRVLSVDAIVYYASGRTSSSSINSGSDGTKVDVAIPPDEAQAVSAAAAAGQVAVVLLPDNTTPAQQPPNADPTKSGTPTGTGTP